jgi:hypothetical protein
MKKNVIVLLVVAGLGNSADHTAASGWPPTLAEQNDALLRQIGEVHNVSPDRVAALRAIFARSRFMGQGNPSITQHPMTPEACRAKLKSSGIDYENPTFARICGGRYMVPLYNPDVERPEDAAACIDQFEFPDIPCAYPVVWVRAREAAEICEAEGKRLCDAHEWEGACDGRLLEPDYQFDAIRTLSPGAAIQHMRQTHNRQFASSKRWSYGPDYRAGVCAASSQKSPTCNGGGWAQCGSNTFPAGSFPDCHSPLGVYDINGNAAEHMNLPLNESQMSSRGSKMLGYTEMKGSWFIFDAYRAHEDWCRWRAPFWHGSRVMDPQSHSNYHLGFSCCKTIEKKASS